MANRHLCQIDSITIALGLPEENVTAFMRSFAHLQSLNAVLDRTRFLPAGVESRLPVSSCWRDLTDCACCPSAPTWRLVPSHLLQHLIALSDTLLHSQTWTPSQSPERSSPSPGRCTGSSRQPERLIQQAYSHTLQEQAALGGKATGDLTLLLQAIQTTCKTIAMNVRRARLLNLFVTYSQLGW